jgi:hypothetical protein
MHRLYINLSRINTIFRKSKAKTVKEESNANPGVNVSDARHGEIVGDVRHANLDVGKDEKSAKNVGKEKGSGGSMWKRL